MNLKNIIIVCLLLLFPAAASAQVSFKRQPGEQLNFEIQRGTTKEHSIIVINLEEEPIDVDLYATDGRQTNRGGFTVSSRTVQQTNIGQWVSFKKDSLHLEGKEEIKVEFVMSIPADMTPGVYAGGLVVEPIIEREKLEATGAIVRSRIAVPLYIIIPGKKVTEFEWTDFTHTFDNKHTFSIHLGNQGNTVIQVTGQIELTDSFGKRIEIPIREMTLFPGDKSAPIISWKKVPFFGFYSVRANLTFSELDSQLKKFIEFDSQSRELTFSIIPWPAVFGLLTLIILIILAIVVKMISHNSFIKKCIKYNVQDGDTLKEIAEKHNITWEKLAKINNLKAPYEISKGQNLLVPPKKT